MIGSYLHLDSNRQKERDRDRVLKREREHMLEKCGHCLYNLRYLGIVFNLGDRE